MMERVLLPLFQLADASNVPCLHVCKWQLNDMAHAVSQHFRSFVRSLRAGVQPTLDPLAETI